MEYATLNNGAKMPMAGNRIEILVAKPVRFVDSSHFAAEIFPAVIDQRTSPLSGSSCCLRVGFRPPPRMTF